MAYDAYFIAYRRNRWIVTHRGRDLGSFFFRSKALKVAVEAAHWDADSGECNIYIHDSSGRFYTAWRGSQDSISVLT
jgi:hypothetical protein